MPRYQHPDLVAAVYEKKEFPVMGFTEFKESVWAKIPEYDDEYKALATLLWFTGARIEEARRLQIKDIEVTKKAVEVTIPGGVKGARSRTLPLPRGNAPVEHFADYVSEKFPKQYVFPSFVKAKNPRELWEYRARKYGIERNGQPIPHYFFRHNIESLIVAHAKDIQEAFILPFYVQGKRIPFFMGSTVSRYQHPTRLLADTYYNLMKRIIQST